MIVRSKGIETSVLFGFMTNGVVLSTLRAASDLDACFDALIPMRKYIAC
jgi:nicotinamidase-related amidase